MRLLFWPIMTNIILYEEENAKKSWEKKAKEKEEKKKYADNKNDNVFLLPSVIKLKNNKIFMICMVLYMITHSVEEEKDERNYVHSV